MVKQSFLLLLLIFSSFLAMSEESITLPYRLIYSPVGWNNDTDFTTLSQLTLNIVHDNITNNKNVIALMDGVVLESTKNADNKYELTIQNNKNHVQIKYQGLENINYRKGQHVLTGKPIGTYKDSGAAFTALCIIADRKSFESLARGVDGSIDFIVPVGTPVFASTECIVNDEGYDQNNRGLFIETRNTEALLSYNHLSVVKTRPEDEVRIGKIIGYSGSTGLTDREKLNLQVTDINGNHVPLLIYIFFDI